VSVRETTPRVAAKPYLVEKSGEWRIVVPPVVEGTSGPLPSGKFEAAIRMEEVYVASAADDAASIRKGIIGKRALLLTPAIYALNQPIVIENEGFAILGLGFPTLVATSGHSALIVTADHVRVSGVLLEAGTSVDAAEAAPLLRWAGNDGVGNDVFTRSGAFKYAIQGKPSCMRTRADVQHAHGSHTVPSSSPLPSVPSAH